jgi:hypothetical protein
MLTVSMLKAKRQESAIVEVIQYTFLIPLKPTR